MKISVSLRNEDVRFLDDYAQAHGLASRSATVRSAIRTLRAAELAHDYAAAFEEWIGSGESDLWDTVVGDGLLPAS